MSSPTAPTQNIRSKPSSGDTDNNLLRKIAGLLATGAGMGGFDVISDTAVHDGDWGIFAALEDTVIGAITFPTYFQTTGSLVGRTIKAGDRIFGYFKSITLASGSGIAYRAVV